MTATATAKVRVSPPPRHLMRMINPLVRRILTARLLGSRITKIGLLRFTGRRTGRLLCVPAGLHLIDGVPVAFTCRTWRLNFAGGAPVTVIHRAQVRRGRGVLVDATPEQLGSALRQALDNGASPFDLGLKVARSYQPTVADLGTVNLSMIRFELDPPTVGSGT